MSGQSSESQNVQIVYITIKSSYTDAQKRASKKYYEAHKQEVIEKVKQRYQQHREELNEKAKARYRKKKESLSSQETPSSVVEPV